MSEETMIPLWMRNVISLCHAQGGKITSEEIANIAATVKRFTKLGWVLVGDLKRCRHISVEVVGEETNERGHKIKVYRVTRREPETQIVLKDKNRPNTGSFLADCVIETRRIQDVSLENSKRFTVKP